MHDHTQTHSVGLLLTSDHLDAETCLPDNTQHSQQTNVHAPGGIRTRNPSRRTAADPLLRPRGQWDRHALNLLFILQMFSFVPNFP